MIQSSLEAGAYLTVQFPTEFTLTTGTCSLSIQLGLSSSSTCTILSGNIVKIGEPFGGITSVGNDQMKFILPS